VHEGDNSVRWVRKHFLDSEAPFTSAQKLAMSWPQAAFNFGTLGASAGAAAGAAAGGGGAGLSCALAICMDVASMTDIATAATRANLFEKKWVMGVPYRLCGQSRVGASACSHPAIR
jgi:uncharacterized ferredoxin-like protein